jgi:Tfp pilus assembly protein PilV
MKPPIHKTAAFSLIEVTMALSVCAFCLLAIFGLLPIALQSNQAAVQQTAANGILSAVSADLRVTPAASGTTAVTSQQFGISIPVNPVTTSPVSTALYFTSNGQSSTTLNANSSYRLTITFLPNGTNARTATCANLQVTWPAQALPVFAAGSAKMFVAVDRN